MMDLFRKVALAEGVTTLLLFLVAMPLKYFANIPELVPPVGWAHGVAFIAYIALMVMTLPQYRVGVGGWLRTTLAAFVPFGTFLNDSYLKRVQVSGASQEPTA